MQARLRFIKSLQSQNRNLSIKCIHDIGIKSGVYTPLQTLPHPLARSLFCCSSVLPLFHALADLPALVLALQDDEQKHFQSKAVASHGGSSGVAAGEYGIVPGSNRDEAQAAFGMETDPELEAVLALMEGSYMGTLEEASMHGAR